MTLQQEMQTICRPDWKAVQEIFYDNASLKSAKFRTNPLCYIYGKEFHYLYRDEKQFELNAISRREDIDLILGFCKSLRSFDDIAAIMLEQLEMKKGSLMALVRQLLSLQFLELIQKKFVIR
mgnify:FL=1